MNVLTKTIKLLFLETRPHFLLLSVVLSCVGTSMAWYDGCFKLLFFILAFVGLLLIHTSRNVLNDRQVPHKLRLVGGVERPNGSRGTIKNEISFQEPRPVGGELHYFDNMSGIDRETVRGSLSQYDTSRVDFLPVMGLNVGVILITQGLIILGYMLSRYLIQ